MRHGTTTAYRDGCRCDECRAAKSAANREYENRNREKITAYRSVYRAQRTEVDPGFRPHIRANVKRWKAANPDAELVYRQRRRAKRRSAGSFPFTSKQLRQRLSMFDGCWVCGGTPEAVDHVKPLSKGGLHALCNLRPICGSCNSRKNARWPFAA